MHVCIYPDIEKENILPFYLVGIGINECQCHIMREKGHPHPQLFYCLHGEGTLKIGEETYCVQPHMGFFIPAYCEHEYYPHQEVWEVNWIDFDGFALQETLEKMGFNRPGVHKLDDVSGLEKLFEEICVILKERGKCDKYRISSLVYAFLIKYYESSQESIEEVKEINGAISDVINYIDSNYKKAITLEELCKVGNVSPQYLCKLFKLHTGMRPTSYIAKRRIKEAEKLLQLTNYTIGEIAYKVGFNNNNYFSTLFKRYQNISPIEYRRKYS